MMLTYKIKLYLVRNFALKFKKDHLTRRGRFSVKI